MNILPPVYHEPSARSRELTSPASRPRKVVFSPDFHETVHRFASPVCRSQNKTPLRGLYLHALYTWRYRLRQDLQAATLCNLGRHHYTECHSPRRGTFYACFNCTDEAPT